MGIADHIKINETGNKNSIGDNMKSHLIICSSLFCVIFAVIIVSSSDVQAKKFNPEDIKKQMEQSGANVDGSQTQEERLEALRKQKGLEAGDGDTAHSNTSTSTTKNAADIKIPTGTQVMIKLDKTLDSKEMGEGDQFTGKLEADLVIDDFLLAPGGSKVYGTIVSSTRARNVAGTSVLEFKLVGLTIDKQMRSIESSIIRVESKKSGRLQASASIDADTDVEFKIGELGSDIDKDDTQTISGPDKKATDRIDERRNSRKHRRD